MRDDAQEMTAADKNEKTALNAPCGFNFGGSARPVEFIPGRVIDGQQTFDIRFSDEGVKR